MVMHRSAHAIYLERLRNLAKARAAKRALHGGYRRRRLHHHLYGRGFFSTIGNALGKVNQFAKDNKLATNALGLLRATGLDSKLQGSPLGGIVNGALNYASEKGYGRRRIHRR